MTYKSKLPKGVYNNNGSLYIGYTPYKGAKRIKQPTGLQIKEPGAVREAEAILAKIRTDIRTGRFFPNTELCTVQGLSDMWFNREKTRKKKSKSDDEQRFKVIVDFFGPTKPASLLRHTDIDAFDAFLETRITKDGERITVATKNRYKTLLRASLKYAKSRGVAVHDTVIAAISMEQENNTRDRICSQDEYEEIIRLATGDINKRKHAREFKLAVMIAYRVPLRRGAIRDIERNSVNHFTKRAAIKQSESDNKKRPASVPLPEGAIDIIKELPPRLDGKLFSIPEDEISHMFREYADRVGATDLHFHDLKHTALTNLEGKGLSPFDLRAMSGNRTLASLQRYIHPDNSAGERAIREMEAEEKTRGR